MGVDTIGRLAEITENADLKRHLEDQYREYSEIHSAAKQKLNENGYDEKGIGMLDKIKTYIMINMQTLQDRSASHIAEMLIIGSNMGVINAQKNLNKYTDAEPDIKKLMEKLLAIEENNMAQLRRFL